MPPPLQGITVVSIEQAVAAARREQDGGLIVLPDSFLVAKQDIVVASTARQRVPAVYAIRPFAAAGGLIAYGIDRAELLRRAADRDRDETRLPLFPGRNGR